MINELMFDENEKTFNMGFGEVQEVGGSSAGYTDTQIDLMLAKKADKETTYTKEEIDKKINDIDIPKPDLSDYATKEFAQGIAITEAQAVASQLNARLVHEYYNKTEIDTITGDIDSALEEIIAIQNQLMGVSK